MEALAPFTCEAPPQDPPVLPYLHERRRTTVDVQVAADIIPAGYEAPHRLASANYNTMWVTYLIFPVVVGVPIKIMECKATPGSHWAVPA